MTGETTDALIRSRQPGENGGSLSVRNVKHDRLRVGNLDKKEGETYATAFVFKLPDLGAVESPFETATLSFKLNKVDRSTTFNADLYGIAARVENAVSKQDFFVGDDDDAEATKLQDSILTPSTEVGITVSEDMSEYLNSQYAGGKNVGRFVFLRLNRDGSTDIVDEVAGYTIAAADNEADAPVITYTAKP